MRVKGKRVLKNGATAGYVYYSKDKKWKWRIISGPKSRKGGKKKKKGGNKNNVIHGNLNNWLPKGRNNNNNVVPEENWHNTVNHNTMIDETNFLKEIIRYNGDYEHFNTRYSKPLNPKNLEIIKFIGEPSDNGLVMRCIYNGKEILLKVENFYKTIALNGIKEFVRTKLARIIIDNCEDINVVVPDVYGCGIVSDKDLFWEKVAEYVEKEQSKKPNKEIFDDRVKGNLYKAGLFKHNKMLGYNGNWSEPVTLTQIKDSYNNSILSYIEMEELRNVKPVGNFEGLWSEKKNRLRYKKIIKDIRNGLSCLNTGINFEGKHISIRHADLHDKNILINPQKKIFLIDFGETSPEFDSIRVSNIRNTRKITQVYKNDPLWKSRWITSKYNNSNNNGINY